MLREDRISSLESVDFNFATRRTDGRLDKGKKDERIIKVRQIEQQLRLVVMRDATAMLGEEEYVSNMVQKQRNVFVVMRDVPTMSLREEFVSGTVQR